ncbi:hypothetical protein A4A49_03740 [Nicotiana attenuata]|uniref:Uncharacterized protein n=1 Tax=Nicotiana attenuata TaxID=49451 RepID=A0A314KZS2_NICAT|nr:hypothetical protein A4A49_03740 [Nicotiana attenuata]
MQGDYESQCRNKIRDESIKTQKEAQLNKEKEQKRDKPKDDEFQTIYKKKVAKVRFHNNTQMEMSNKPNGYNHDEQSLTEIQPQNHQATNQDQREQKANNKKDTILLLENDQNSRHSFYRNTTNDNDTNKHTEEEANSRNDIESNNNKNNHLINLGDAHNTYLKLINSTSLEEDKDSEDMYISKHIHMKESSFEDDREEDSAEDGDYADEMCTEESNEFESVDTESFQNDVQPINHTTNDHAAQLIETFNSNALVEVNVSFEIDKIVERTHLSPRGRERGRNNGKNGRHNPRGRGGRLIYQQAMVIPQEQNLSN